MMASDRADATVSTRANAFVKVIGMMHEFLANNRENLLIRCREKVAKRTERGATRDQLTGGIPLFLEQLLRTLKAEEEDFDWKISKAISGYPGSSTLTSELGLSAAAHGEELLKLGYTVDQVVHDYGDLCQAITDLAVERDAPFSVNEFRTLNRCLDNAIADAVAAFTRRRDTVIETRHTARADERLGMLVHEFRNALSTANLAVSALEAGQLAITGATGTVLKRCLSALTILCEESLDEVRRKSRDPAEKVLLSIASIIKEAQDGAALMAIQKGCVFTVAEVDEYLLVEANPRLLLAAIDNLLQNAFRFTHPGTEVHLRAYAAGPRLHIDISDHCGGLSPEVSTRLFTPFFRHVSQEKSGLGLGLSISRRNVEAYGGMLSARDVPEIGCVFTINLPLIMIEFK